MLINVSRGELSAAGNSHILSCMNQEKDKKELDAFNRLQGGNLKRLRTLKGWSQAQMAKESGIEQSKISAYENGLGFNKETMIHFCKILNVKSWQFNWDQDMPVAKDEREKKRLELYRIEERLGIADQVREHEEIWIERAEKHAAGDEIKTEGFRVGLITGKEVAAIKAAAEAQAGQTDKPEDKPKKRLRR